MAGRASMRTISTFSGYDVFALTRGDEIRMDIHWTQEAAERVAGGWNVRRMFLVTEPIEEAAGRSEDVLRPIEAERTEA